MSPLLVAGWKVALAEPATDPTLRLTEQALRQEGAPVFLGTPDRSPLHQATMLRRSFDADALPEPLRPLLGPEWAAVTGDTDLSERLALRPGGAVSLGSQRPEYLQGDREPGLVSGRAWADTRLYPGIAELSARPELTVDLGEVADLGDGAATGDGVGVALRELWVGVRTDQLSAGAGLRERWIGPGRHGSLMLTDNARPAPMVSGAAETPRLGRFGRLRAEVGAGWLDAPRDDVDHPGWLMMDFRWMPVPIIELGLSRVGIFGGEGRPTPSIGQLLLPTDPHIYDDPDQVLPDQDEMAAVDFRLLLPIGLVGDYVELYWQYGGEDVISREFLGVIPYPALAGVGNLYGAEVSFAPWSLNIEGVRVFDDYFRWYTGHRVYHDGLTQAGQSMGYAPGGDSMGLWGAVTWLDGDLGGQLYAEQVRRIGVVASLDNNLLALGTDERRFRVGVVGWKTHGLQGWWRLDVSVEHIQGVDFILGQDETVWRLALRR